MVRARGSLRSFGGGLALAALLVTALALPSAASSSERVVRAYLWDQPMLDELQEWADVWGVLKGNVAVVRVDEAGERRMKAAGFLVETDAHWTAQLTAPPRSAEGQPAGIPGFACYRTVEETLATGDSLAAAYPALASFVDIGDSYLKTQNAAEGYDLKMLILTNSAIADTKPRVMMMGSIHAREYTTAELVTRFAEHLLAGYGTDPDATWLLDRHEVHLLLVANPDGRKKAETGLLWRKNLRNDGCASPNDIGTDLNRGYDFEWGCCGGSSGAPCAQTYRGSSPANEPEVQAIQNHLQAIFPDQRGPGLTAPADPNTTGALFDLHSFGQVMLSTWGFTTTPPPDSDRIQTLGRKYGWFVDYESRVGSLGTVDGTSKDFAYGDLGIPAYTIELGSDFFQQCDYFEHLMVDDHVKALTWAAKVVRTSYITPSGPDALDVELPAVTALAGDLVTLRARIDDTRFQNDNGVEPTQNIQTAQYSLNLPAAHPLSTPLPMVATDGSFDAKVEAVDATIDTTAFPQGRHIVFVRGQDASGTWGSESAVFLDVATSASSTVAGTVRDAQSGDPIAATVRAGISETTSDPVTGAYSLLVLPGTYEVVAESATHAASSQPSVTVPSGGVTGVNLNLPPYTEVLAEDVEGGAPGWTTQAPWAIVTEQALSGTHSWTDSPGGNYSSNRDVSLTSPSIDLSGLEGTVLSFHHLYDLESGFDIGWVEVSADGGAWQRVDGFARAGFDTDWSRVEVAVPQLDGVADARVRFRLITDGSAVADGWHVDDILVRAYPEGIAAEIFTDGFESGDVSAWSSTVP